MAKVSSSTRSTSRPSTRSTGNKSQSTSRSSQIKQSKSKAGTGKTAPSRESQKVRGSDRVQISSEARKPGEKGGADSDHIRAMMGNFGASPAPGSGTATPPESPGLSVRGASEPAKGIRAGEPAKGTGASEPAKGAAGEPAQGGPGSPPKGEAEPPKSGNGMVGAPVRDKDLWSVPDSPWSQLQGGGRTREWTAGDDNGRWREYEVGGQNWRTRNYTEKGVNWSETIQEGNRWRYREGGMAGLTREAEARGVQQVQLPGPDGKPMDIKVSGGATPQELERVKKAIEAMPPQARKHAREIVLSQNLGQVLGQGMNPHAHIQGVGAMAGNDQGRMVLDRTSLGSDKQAAYLIHHEAGHNLAASTGNPETSELWRSLPGSVSPYGNRSAAEDFAETHRYVVGNWNSYVNSGAVPLAQSGGRPVTGNGPLGIERTPSAAKAMEIMRLYGWKGPESGI